MKGGAKLRGGPRSRLEIVLPRGSDNAGDERRFSWRGFRRRHVAVGIRVCLLSQLVNEVFSTELWKGGQLSWRSEKEVCE
jgi:hypothetical protein